MGSVIFYHLTRSPVEVTLPMLLGKSLQAGWRVVIRGTNRARMAWLDDKLWLDREDGFVPHAVDGGPYDADQPVLLTLGHTFPNGASCLMAFDGAPVAPDEVAALERVCVLFDGNDPEALALAREQWKALTGAGHLAQYWSEEGGGWEKKAER